MPWECEPIVLMNLAVAPSAFSGQDPESRTPNAADWPLLLQRYLPRKQRLRYCVLQVKYVKYQTSPQFVCPVLLKGGAEDLPCFVPKSASFRLF